MGMCRAMECPQLQSLKPLDRADCCVALMDGDHTRMDRIRSEPRRGCHVCDAVHDLRTCPWLQGMPEAMREDLKRAYKTLRIREKDKILRHWLEIRRYRSSAAPVRSALRPLPIPSCWAVSCMACAASSFDHLRCMCSIKCLPYFPTYEPM